MDAFDPIRPKIAKCLRLLASDIDGEAMGAVRALGRTLQGEALSFNDLGDAVERGVALSDRPSTPDSAKPETWAEIAAFCLRVGATTMNPKERDFVVNIIARVASGGQPSEKQGVWLEGICGRLQASQKRGAA